MHVRQNINLLLRRSHYQLVKVLDSGETPAVPPELLLDDHVLSARIAPERKHTWLIAAPKSGSTWLSTLLEILLGWRTVGLAGGAHDQEPDTRQLVRYPGENIFSPHQHCQAAEATVAFIRRFRIKPIIQGRNVHDTIVSFRDHCLRESLRFSMVYIDEAFLKLTADEQFQFIIDMVLPWHLSFYASWFRIQKLSPENLLYVNYDELLADPRNTLRNLLNYLGESRTEAEIENAMSRASRMDTRKNHAVTGRGKKLLSGRHLERIRQLRGNYPHIDFSRVGL